MSKKRLCSVYVWVEQHGKKYYVWCGKEAVANENYCKEHDPAVVHAETTKRRRKAENTVQKDYIEALEKTVIKVADTLFHVLTFYSVSDLVDVTGFSLEECKKIKEMADSFPRIRSHVKGYVRRVIG